MAIQTRETLKSWFQRGMKPLASQFADWIDSFWHKNEKIPVASVDNLTNLLAQKQNKLIAGNNISINASNVISANVYLPNDGSLYQLTDYGKRCLTLYPEFTTEELFNDIISNSNSIATEAFPVTILLFPGQYDFPLYCEGANLQIICIGGYACFAGINFYGVENFVLKGLKAVSIIDDNAFEYMIMSVTGRNLKVIDCIGGDDSFYNDNFIENSEFIDCKGGANSFYNIEGILKNCTGGDGSFLDVAGSLYNCQGGNNSFSFIMTGNNQVRTMDNCCGLSDCFTGDLEEACTVKNCIGEGDSFGYGYMEGKVINCYNRFGDGSGFRNTGLQTDRAAFINCIDQYGSIINRNAELGG